jgi:cytidine deaminase
VTQLSDQEQQLLDAARMARDGAYAPYTKYLVGAALRASSGEVFTGANVENAAISTICAERVAVGYAVSHGVRSFSQIAVIGTGAPLCTPCGVCRQVLYEFAPDIEVLATSGSGDVRRFVLSRDLLPHGFGPAALADV